MPTSPRFSASKKSGFTLVELLIVITIIGILSVIGFTTYGAVQKSARDVIRKDDLKAIKVALTLYYQNHKQYPISSNWVTSTSTNWIPGLTNQYIPKLPKDPLKNDGEPWENDQYAYGYFGNEENVCGLKGGQFFALAAQLENKSDNLRNELKNYKWCDGQGLYSDLNWSKYSYVVTSEY